MQYANRETLKSSSSLVVSCSSIVERKKKIWKMSKKMETMMKMFLLRLCDEFYKFFDGYIF